MEWLLNDRGQTLPVDSDMEVQDWSGVVSRPVHLRKRFLALVGLGGMAGTAAREGLTLCTPALNGLPVVTLVINVVGAFLLGLLLELLARGGADTGLRRTMRLLLGAGVLGGFTTYSSLATDTALLLHGGSALDALVYAFGTVILGAAASWGGVAVGTTTHRLRSGRRGR